MNPAHQLLFAHLRKLDAKAKAWHERSRELEKQVTWLTQSRNAWRQKALAYSRKLQAAQRRARSQHERAERWKYRALRQEMPQRGPARGHLTRVISARGTALLDEDAA